MRNLHAEADPQALVDDYDKADKMRGMHYAECVRTACPTCIVVSTYAARSYARMSADPKARAIFTSAAHRAIELDRLCGGL